MVQTTMYNNRSSNSSMNHFDKPITHDNMPDEAKALPGQKLATTPDKIKKND